MTGRLVVLASGSGSNLQALIDATIDGRLDATIEAVYVNRRTAFARERADQHGIAQDFVPLGPYRDRHEDPRAAREAYDADLAERVAAHAPDAIVLAGWMHLFTDTFLGRFPGRVVNLHPALPGTFPGAHAIDDAWEAKVRAGLDHTGVMIHLVPDEGVDDGPVLLSEVVPIRDDDTRETLEERIHEVEHRLLVEAVASLIGAS
ncbi:MAG: phosphoribosylglycinamide formyltransferase [Acidimicrobiales bacterium]|nr:phosphoribosylglycinamide formyltransferase [Acidimicrobiales bacterium]